MKREVGHSPKYKGVIHAPIERGEAEQTYEELDSNPRPYTADKRKQKEKLTSLYPELLDTSN